MKRIRYEDNGYGTFVSKQVIKTALGDMRASYNINSHVVRIFMAADDDDVRCIWTYTDKPTMLNAIKQWLIDHGASFEDEERKEYVARKPTGKKWGRPLKGKV